MREHTIKMAEYVIKIERTDVVDIFLETLLIFVMLVYF